MSPIQNIQQSMLRVDYARADKYIYPEAPKQSFMQKLGRGLGKFMNFAGPIGAAVTAIALPGIGLPIAAGIYGMTRFSQDQMAKSDMKRSIDVANQPQPQNINLTGLFEQMPIQAGEKATSFMAPSGMEPSINQVINERNYAAQSELGQI